MLYSWNFLMITIEKNHCYIYFLLVKSHVCIFIVHFYFLTIFKIVFLKIFVIFFEFHFELQQVNNNIHLIIFSFKIIILKFHVKFILRYDQKYFSLCFI